ncbi:MAG: OmpA family protein [Mangrovibacterium sp.]
MKNIYVFRSIRHTLFILCPMILCFISPLYSQSLETDTLLNKTTLGIRTGVNFPIFRYSDADYNTYKNSLFPREIAGIYLESYLTQTISLRPEISFIGKGQKIEDLGVFYKLTSNYLEFRMPLVYTFNMLKLVHPYVALGPTFGIVTGGKIKLDDWNIDVTKANMKPTEIGLIAGFGVKAPFQIKNMPFILSGELTYSYGLTNTFSGQETDETAIALNKDPYTIDHTRKNRGVGVTVSMAMPLKNLISLFKKKKEPEPVIEPAVIAQEPDPVIELPEKDCYTIEEMITYLNEGLNVNNRKICMYDINFETDKSTLDRVSMSYLDGIVVLLENFPSLYMKINGHTDNVGTDEYNIKLSEKRALAVYNYLTKRVVPSCRLSYFFYGNQRSIARNDTEEGRAKNRRVELEIVYP